LALRLSSFGGYGLALAALALVVFGAYDSYPFKSTKIESTISEENNRLRKKSKLKKSSISIDYQKQNNRCNRYRFPEVASCVAPRLKLDIFLYSHVLVALHFETVVLCCP